jgi:hypothetical protein
MTICAGPYQEDLSDDDEDVVEEDESDDFEDESEDDELDESEDLSDDDDDAAFSRRRLAVP